MPPDVNTTTTIGTMKKHMEKTSSFLISLCVFLTLSGCAALSGNNPEHISSPEPVGNYLVMTYELPFVYEEDQPRQEAFLTAIQQMIAPADWQDGPDQMKAIANMLIVSTTPDNHMRIERFFDSIPGMEKQHSEVWVKPQTEAEDSEGGKDE